MEPPLATKISPALFTEMPKGLLRTRGPSPEFWMRIFGLVQEEGLQLNTWSVDFSTASSWPLVVPAVPNAVPSPAVSVKVKTWVGALKGPPEATPATPAIFHTPVPPAAVAVLK